MTSVSGLDRRVSATTRLLLAILFTGAVLTSFPVWWQIAPPILLGAPARVARHVGHVPWVYLHAATGTLMLFSGSAALWVGWTRRLFRIHRRVGATYLLSGAATAGAALVLTVTNVHHDVNQAAATGTLAAAWLAAAAMAYRAIRNHRVDAHRGWVLRSYVLTWSFVFCRGLGNLISMEKGAEQAALWLTWIGPLLICEVILQWNAGRRRSGAA